MKRRIDPDMPIGKLTRIADFLPPPDQLVFPKDDVKVTLALSRYSVAFFKLQARKNRTKYQRMIKALLDHYVSHYRLGR